MAESRTSERQDRRADLGVGDDLYTEDIGEAGAAVVPEGAEDEVLALLVEDEDSRQHGRGVNETMRGVRRSCRGWRPELRDDAGEASWGSARAVSGPMSSRGFVI